LLKAHDARDVEQGLRRWGKGEPFLPDAVDTSAPVHPYITQGPPLTGSSHVQPAWLGRHDAQPPAGSRVAERSTSARVEESGSHFPFYSKSKMPNRIDARVDPVQPPFVLPPRDACRCKADLFELDARHDPPLPVGQLRHPNFGP
jgi:hypothetical protein